jgi:hypothetical protein
MNFLLFQASLEYLDGKRARDLRTRPAAKEGGYPLANCRMCDGGRRHIAIMLLVGL